MATTTLVSGPFRIRLARFTVASAIATGISQLVLLTVFWVGWTDATAASTLAFLVGSVPHFLMVRYWAWRDTDPGRLRHQLTTYFTVTLIGGIASIALTTVTDWLLGPLVVDQGWRALMLTLSYLAASGPVFLIKFALFDRAFASRRTQRAYDATSSTRVRAANPVAPAVTSS
ncbi:MAG: GtrA family protein [Actinophytocola sp.]|uniref:GtrA family protein n=1 Tax=Actinophytocola sp. TaxID=1872138 RepID=UPI001324E33C|nr:GtrA family protein [Actinophytocola sp.]MPZ84654.1 GtrA family protein [Actinophytocola sp.]